MDRHAYVFLGTDGIYIDEGGGPEKVPTREAKMNLELKTDRFSLVLDQRGILQSLKVFGALAGKPSPQPSPQGEGVLVPMVELKTILTGDNRLPSSYVSDGLNADWRFDNGEWATFRYTAYSDWIEVQYYYGSSGMARGSVRPWLFAAATEYGGPLNPGRGSPNYNHLHNPQALQIADDLFLGVLPLNIETDVEGFTDQHGGLLVRPTLKAPLGWQRFAIYVCTKAELRDVSSIAAGSSRPSPLPSPQGRGGAVALPARIEHAASIHEMWKLKSDPLNEAPYLFLTQNAGNAEKFWPTPAQVIAWCRLTGISRVIILNWMLFDYYDLYKTGNAYQPTKWADAMIPALKAAGIAVGAHIGFFLPPVNPFAIANRTKFMGKDWTPNNKAFGDIEVDDPKMVWTEDFATIWQMGDLVGRQMAKWKIDGIYHDIHTADYFSMVFADAILTRFRRDFGELHWWGGGGLCPAWQSASNPYDWHLEGDGGRVPLLTYFSLLPSEAKMNGLLMATDTGWGQLYTAPTSQYGFRELTLAEKTAYFDMCRLNKLPVGLKLSWEQMQKAMTDGTVNLIRSATAAWKPEGKLVTPGELNKKIVQ